MQVSAVQKGGWTIVWLLFFFMLINFIDKAIIGLAAVPMMKEIGLTPKEFGLVNSSFFFLFYLGADSVPDAWLRRAWDLDRVPRRFGCRRRAGVSRRDSRSLQMVSR